jgi:hypothetical protein
VQRRARRQERAGTRRSIPNVPLQTVEPLRLYRQITGQIAALIDDGEFPVGSRLPVAP